MVNGEIAEIVAKALRDADLNADYDEDSEGTEPIVIDVTDPDEADESFKVTVALG